MEVQEMIICEYIARREDREDKDALYRDIDALINGD
jgi:hypothetical protein